MSIIATIVRVLKDAKGARLTAAQIYQAGIFETEESLAVALSTWARKEKPFLLRHKPEGGRFEYWLSDTVPPNIDAQPMERPERIRVVAAKPMPPPAAVRTVNLEGNVPLKVSAAVPPRAVPDTPPPAVKVAPVPVPAPNDFRVPTLEELITGIQFRLLEGQSLCIRPDHVGVIALGHHFKVDLSDAGALKEVLDATAVLVKRAA